MADSEFEREMAEAIENAEIAEVVCVILPMINQCLVFDSRATKMIRPLLPFQPLLDLQIDACAMLIVPGRTFLMLML